MSTALVVQENKNEIKVNDGELTIDTKNDNKIEGKMEGKMEGKARVSQPPSTLSLSVSGAGGGAGGGVGVGDKNNSKDRDKDKSNNNSSSHSSHSNSKSKSTPHECPVVSAIAVQQQFSQAEHFRKLWESLR